MKKIKIGIISLGCDKNRVDSEVMIGNLLSAGYEITPNELDADVLIVNTCAFIAEARRESEDTIRKLRETVKRSGAKIIVSGCYPQKFLPKLKEKFEFVNAFVGTQYDDIATVVSKVVGGNIETPKIQGQRILTTLSHYAYLKISDGCDNKCTYCLIPQIRGAYKSRPIDELVSEAERLAQEGVKELVLVAQDVTSYHLDITAYSKLVELIKRLSAIEGIKWLRMMYCYPERITDELIDEMAANEKVVKYLDIPLQHTSTKILKLMGRQSTSESIKLLIDKLRERIPGIALRTTLMVGFPGETETEFKDLYEFIKYNKLTNVGFFAYSEEEGTAAARFEETVSKEEKQYRLNLLAAAQRKVANTNAKESIGRRLDVIVDEFLQVKNGQYIYEGRCYMNAPKVDGVVFFSSDVKLNTGEIVAVSITGAEQYDLLGEMVK